MTVIRIVCNFASADVPGLAAFYRDLLNLNILMDQGWIITLGSGELGPVQLSVASQGGAGTPVPDISVEVDDVDEVHARARDMGVTVTYPLTDESWGVRRFFVVDPMGREINILSHV
ncbi:Glyoxalase-like domain protein [Sulfitobacter sp. THAF37]|uniref:VOC family protein n=1 Tax=Sulfitobacter sp. THAF37 TaxID=2587855 RepID=UPI001268B847|nr:VOC family protein [Sulfitobacter sp. THAF37]QFT57436.1 Glyoxalase-like domain protein [Sulfitobacter sp. THAF37]